MSHAKVGTVLIVGFIAFCLRAFWTKRTMPSLTLVVHFKNMKRILAACFLTLGASNIRASEAILPYSAFGPQVAAYKLIGMEWWQWDSHGDCEPRDYPIKVVVFWGQTRDETAKRHPVDQVKLLDFRYVEYSKAVEYLESTIKEFKEAKSDATPLERTLTQLRKRKADQDELSDDGRSRNLNTHTMNSIQGIAGLITGSGMLIALLSIPLILRRVPPNALYGIRTKASFSSDADWYRINAIGGRYLAGSGTVLIAVGLVGFFLSASLRDLYCIGAGIITFLAVVIPCIRLCVLKPSTSRDDNGPSA